jgi:hypothetical protein
MQVERVIRVRGEEHIGGIMIKLADVLDIAMDWSDHALWWPAKNTWLHNTRCTRLHVLLRFYYNAFFFKNISTVPGIECCYITVDSATTALQNGACTYLCISTNAL